MTPDSPERADVCPFHGPIPDNKKNLHPVAVYCSGCATLYRKEVLSSAYCWKRIDELETRIKELEAQLGK